MTHKFHISDLASPRERSFTSFNGAVPGPDRNGQLRRPMTSEGAYLVRLGALHCTRQSGCRASAGW